MASAIAMDKVMTKRVAGRGPAPRRATWAPTDRQREVVRTVPDELGLP